LGLRYERCVEQFWADFIEELEQEQAAHDDHSGHA
jgi:hypothetical protein